MEARRRQAVLKRAFEKHALAMRKNVHGLVSPITLPEVLAAWERRPVRCATTGWTDDLRIVPARPGAFTAANMELVHRTLYTEFKMDGAPGSCYQALLGGDAGGSGGAPVVARSADAQRDEAQLAAWVGVRPLRFVVEEVIATANLPTLPTPDELLSQHSETLDHSCAALRVRGEHSGEPMVLVLASGAPTFLMVYPNGCTSWELPDGAQPPGHWDRARGGLLCRLFGDPPAVPPLCVVAHRRPTLLAVRLPRASDERQLRTQEMLYSMFGGQWAGIGIRHANYVLSQMHDISTVYGPARLMNHRPAKTEEEHTLRVEPSAMSGSALKLLGIDDEEELAALCCARRMTDSATKEPFDEREFAAQEGARAEADGEDWGAAHRAAKRACAQLLRAEKLRRGTTEGVDDHMLWWELHLQHGAIQLNVTP